MAKGIKRTWKSQECHLNPFQSSYRSQDQLQTSVCKYKVHVTAVSLSPSGGKCQLSPAVERKWLRMVKRQQKNTKKQVWNELEAAGRQVSVSTVKHVLHHHVLRGCCWRKEPWLRRWQLKAQLKSAAGHMDKEKPSRVKFSGQMK